MSSKTTNYNLHKIDLTDAPPDITVLNQNWDTIDEKLKSLENADKNQSNYLPLTGGTVTDTLILSKVQDTEADSYTGPALVVGGEPSAAHLEIDNNEIQAKLGRDKAGNLFLNSNGGKVSIGFDGLEMGSGSNISPETALQGNVGTADLPFNRAYLRYYYLYGGENAQYGSVRVGTTGTTNTDGTALVELGNATPTGTAHNASGKITMYTSGTGFTNLLPKSNTTGSNVVYLPNGTGTLMLESEGAKIQTGSSKPTSNTITINCDFTPRFVAVTAGSGQNSSAIFVKGSGNSLMQTGGSVTWNTNSVKISGSFISSYSSSTFYYVVIG